MLHSCPLTMWVFYFSPQEMEARSLNLHLLGGLEQASSEALALVPWLLGHRPQEGSAVFPLEVLGRSKAAHWTVHINCGHWGRANQTPQPQVNHWNPPPRDGPPWRPEDSPKGSQPKLLTQKCEDMNGCCLGHHALRRFIKQQ